MKINVVATAIENMGGQALVGRMFGVSRQAVYTWQQRGSVPVQYMRVISELSDMPLEDFLKLEELRAGVKYDSLLSRAQEERENAG